MTISDRAIAAYTETVPAAPELPAAMLPAVAAGVVVAVAGAAAVLVAAVVAAVAVVLLVAALPVTMPTNVGNCPRTVTYTK
jgi:hypothetical protein